MKRYVKGALIFTGGVTTGLTIGGIAVAALIVKHKKYVIKCIADAVDNWINRDLRNDSSPMSTCAANNRKEDGNNGVQ
jgi:hypothetical protein